MTSPVGLSRAKALGTHALRLLRLKEAAVRSRLVRSHSQVAGSNGHPGHAKQRGRIRPTRRGWIVIAVASGLLCFLVVDALATVGRIRPRVEVGGLDLGGMRYADAEQALTERAQLLVSQEAAFTAEDREFRVAPDAVSFFPDVEATLAAAKRVGRSGNPAARAWQRTRSRVMTSTIDWRSSLDVATTQAAVDQWADTLDDAGHEAGIRAEGARLVPVAPQPGRNVDRDEAVGTIRRGLETWPRRQTELPFVTQGRRTSAEDARRAAEQANRMVSAPIALRAPDGEVELSPAELASMLEAVPARRSGGWTLRVIFSPDLVGEVLGERTEAFERPARSATFAVSGTSVSIRPSQDGQSFDPLKTAEALADAARQSPPRTADAAFTVVTPTLTTEGAEALNITERVSTFTTRHPPGQPRVRNIHLMADAVDGAIVAPGQVFSLNRHVGERTEAKGYVPAPMIWDGEYRDEVGGGVSQFATTIFNAVFFGGYEFVNYKAHSYYISRYPAGREATVSFPAPDFRFRNNSSSGVLIKTFYTSSSITVSLFGTSNGTVRAESEERTNITAPPEQRRLDPSLPPGREVVRQSGSEGFDIVVYRVITRDGETTRQRFFTRYRPEPRIIAVGPGTPQPTPEPTPEEPPPPPPEPTQPPPPTQQPATPPPENQSVEPS